MPRAEFDLVIRIVKPLYSTTKGEKIIDEPHLTPKMCL